MSASIVRAERIEFQTFAHVCDLHPDLLETLIELGLLEPVRDSDGERWFERRHVDTVSRVRRLKAGLGLSYSAIAVVAQLIDRIDELENELLTLRSRRSQHE